MPPKFAKRFTAAGYPATSVALEGLAGQNDQAIFRHARQYQLTLVTIDSDFLRTVDFPPPHSGIIYVKRHADERISTTIAQLIASLATIAQSSLANHTYVLDGTAFAQYS